MTIASAALLLFLILDPLGNIPVFLSLLRSLPPHRHHRTRSCARSSHRSAASG